jgi:predicted RNase H-like HicB family nuclease
MKDAELKGAPWVGEADDGGTVLASRVAFRILVEPDAIDGGFIAECPNLPGCMSQGDTPQKALENLVEAIAGVLEVRMQRNLRDDLVSDLEVQVTPLNRTEFELPVY